MSTVPSARGTFVEPLDPYQARSDGGIGAPPPPPPPPSPPRMDAGIGGVRDAGIILGPMRDGGI